MRLPVGLSVVLILASPSASGAGLLGTPDGSRLNVAVRSFVELRFRDVVRQSRDVSCGAAALATLLTHYWGEPITEQQAIEAMAQLGDRQRIEQEGFSLLEMKRFAEGRGYAAVGYRVEGAANLVKLPVPVISLVNVRGYAHFVVIKGVAGDHVFIADPAFGNRVRSLERFEREWNGVILAVVSPTRVGNTAFMADALPRTRAGEVILLLDRGLRAVAPGRGEF
jgi:hypothetical protein